MFGYRPGAAAAAAEAAHQRSRRWWRIKSIINLGIKRSVINKEAFRDSQAARATARPALLVLWSILLFTFHHHPPSKMCILVNC